MASCIEYLFSVSNNVEISLGEKQGMPHRSRTRILNEGGVYQILRIALIIAEGLVRE